MNQLKTPLPETATEPVDQDADFKAPLGLKLFLAFFVLLGAMILADSLARLLK